MSVLMNRGLPCPHCNSSDAYAEYDTNFFCFSCKKSVSKDKKSSWATKNIKQNIIDDAILKLPELEELPLHAKLYLYMYNFTNQLIQKHGIGWLSNCNIYSERKGEIVNTGSRLILPHYRDDKLVFYEARSLDKTNKLKYITVGSKKIGRKEIHHNNDSLVIVEDALSAIRVGEVNDCFALLGTHLSNDLFLEIGRDCKYNKYIIWLDSDSPGQIAAHKLCRRLELLGTTVNIVTKNDPKCYSNREIKGYIDNANNQ